MKIISQSKRLTLKSPSLLKTSSVWVTSSFSFLYFRFRFDATFLLQVAQIANAVTPQSSPIPTPKHRKPEYKIEVLIPPNISDPLNLVSQQQQQKLSFDKPRFFIKTKISLDGMWQEVWVATIPFWPNPDQWAIENIKKSPTFFNWIIQATSYMGAIFNRCQDSNPRPSNPRSFALAVALLAAQYFTRVEKPLLESYALCSKGGVFFIQGST